MNQEELDPWLSFGAESDDDYSTDEDVEDNTSAERARLISEANRRLQSDQNCKSNKINMPLQEDSSSHCDISTFQPIDTWPNRCPLYKGPIMAVAMNDSLSSRNRIGGNRGYVATKDLEPGTLLLVEEVAFTWPIEQIGRELGVMSILSILNSERAQDIVKDMEQLHPSKLDVDRICRTNVEERTSRDEENQITNMIHDTKMKVDRNEMNAALEVAKARQITTTNADTKANEDLNELDIIRMLLALRYNGFMSGLYFFFSIFNHDEDCNCIKYMPKEGKQNHHRSEVRTVKNVKKGEALTLSYVLPREVSHATRRSHLWDQHRFDIGADIGSNSKSREMELVRGYLPKSSLCNRDSDQETFHVESALVELEETYEEVKLQLEDKKEAHKAIEDMKSLEMAALELIQASISKLQNERHILLIRSCRLHLNAAEVLVRDENSHLNDKQKVDVLCRFLSSVQRLLPLQLQYLGSHHPDLARTYLDKAMTLNTLISTAPRTLFALKLPNLSNIHSCSKEEDYCRKEYARIKSMFPDDVEEKISSQN